MFSEAIFLKYSHIFIPYQELFYFGYNFFVEALSSPNFLFFVEVFSSPKFSLSLIFF